MRGNQTPTIVVGMLLGRDTEQRRIEALLAAARDGRSGVLVLRGEAGIGKTALLEHAASTAGADALVLRVRGVESEVEIAFAGLHQLLAPVLDTLERLPAPQAGALRGALGLSAAADAERHLAGAGTLAVLGLLAETRPVLVLADDAHWLDRPSASALLFAARRLLADAVVVLVAVREEEVSAFDGAGLDELVLSGLEEGPARALLEARAGRPIAAATSAWLHAATAGNPLALSELAREAPRLRPGPVADPLAVGARIERALGRRLDTLDAGARAALLALAVADDDALGPLTDSLEGLEAAERAGLVVLAPGRAAFAHPLVRSVVLARAGAADRRAAHRAYAAAVATVDADRAAWHAAAGAVAPDEAIAAALAAAAERAGGRGGHAAAASAFELAASLTPAPEPAAARRLLAAESAWLGGDGPRALALLGEPADTGDIAAAHLRGRVLARRGPIPEAIRVLRSAAEAAAADDPATAAEMLAEAAYATVYGNLGTEMDALAARALALAPPGSARARATACIAAGAAGVLRGDPAAERLLEEAWAIIERTPELRDDLALAAWLGVVPAFRRASLDEYAPLERAISRARERGSLGVLPYALFFLGAGQLGAGRWAEAAASFSEAARLGEEAGLVVDAAAARAGLARIEARRGNAGPAVEALEQDVAAGMPFLAAWALHAQGEAALAAGDAEAALSAFEAKRDVLDAHQMHDPDLSAAPELAETLLRLGREDEARAAAAAALTAAATKGQPWALARAQRAAALAGLEDDDGFERALAHHAEAGDTYETARTQLCLGERLRRDGRRAEAREPLRAALHGFEALGATPWAARAAQELRATGEIVRRRDPATLDELTPQELRIASMLAAGATTRQAAAALYVSPKTVEYHLRHVYMKLGVNSRAALAAALAQSSAASNSAARAAPVSSTAR